MAKRILCLCFESCQLRLKGKDRTTFFERGQQQEFALSEAPDHFVKIKDIEVEDDETVEDEVTETVPRETVDSTDEALKIEIENAEVKVLGAPGSGSMYDWDDATEELLLNAEYDVKELIKYAKAKYKLALPSSLNKSVVVSKYVDARNRSLSTASALQNQFVDTLGGGRTS